MRLGMKASPRYRESVANIRMRHQPAHIKYPLLQLHIVSNPEPYEARHLNVRPDVSLRRIVSFVEAFLRRYIRVRKPRTKPVGASESAHDSQVNFHKIVVCGRVVDPQPLSRKTETERVVIIIGAKNLKFVTLTFSELVVCNPLKFYG